MTATTTITPDLLRALGVRSDRASAWAPALAGAAALADITTPRRVAAWLAQLMHESRELIYTTEVWGPTPTQVRYDGRRDLGNTQPGDGRRYLGRGPLQVTGRANYRRCRDNMRAAGVPGVPDFEAHPDELGLPEWGARAAAIWWRDNGVNQYADRGAIDDVSSIVNRGRPGMIANGADDRRRIYGLACRALGLPA